MPQTTDRWVWTFLASVASFVVLSSFVSPTGVTALERALYETVTTAFPNQKVFRWITRLGSETVLFPVATIVIVALPRQLLRRWWMWVAVMVTTSWLEGLGKGVIGRSRPESLGPGFPSGHTAAAAAFYMMAAYFAESLLARRWARYSAYATAAALILAVGVSRIVLQVHWPLDVLGGAALGVAIAAIAVWWHERYAVAWRLSPPSARTRAIAWIYRWQAVIPIPFFVLVLFLKPPFAVDDSLLDIACDVAGGLFIIGGLLLRVWAADHAGPRKLVVHAVPTMLLTAGPYAHMRHPLFVAHALIGIGLMILAESWNGLTVMIGLVILIGRVAMPYEEERLAEQFGDDYRDYCRRVPWLPRPTVALCRASIWVPSWRCMTQEAPALVTTTVLAILAESGDFLSDLLP